MSYIGNTSDAEQEKNISDFRHNRSSTNLVAKNMGTAKISDVLWNHKRDDDSDSEISDSGNFLAKGIHRGRENTEKKSLIKHKIVRCIFADTFA